MADEILFAGGRLDSVSIVSGTPTEITTAGRFDSAYADAGINVPSSTSSFDVGLYSSSGPVLTATTIVSGETLFFHFEGYIQTQNNTAVSMLTFMDSSGFPWIALRTGTGSSNQAALYYNSGTGASPVWTMLGSAFVLINTLAEYDFKIVMGATHTVELYVNRVLAQSGTFTQGSFTNIAKVRMSSGSNISVYSQLFATRNIVSIGAKIKTLRASAAGTNSQWTGAYTDVNEAINSDSTINTANAAALKQTYAMNDIVVPSGYAMRGMWQWLRAKNDGSAPLNIKSLFRVNGVEYTSGNLSNMGIGFNPIGARYDVSPNTGINWSASEWNASEAGFQSET